MGVRVKIKIKTSKKNIETSALVTTGFETEYPEILIPTKLAEELNLYPPAEGSMLEEYNTVGGTTLIIRSSENIHVQIIVKDKETHLAEAIPIISDREEEVLISDKLASNLKISIDDPAEGTWRFRDEPITIKRNSEQPKYWT